MVEIKSILEENEKILWEIDPHWDNIYAISSKRIIKKSSSVNIANYSGAPKKIVFINGDVVSIKFEDIAKIIVENFKEGGNIYFCNDYDKRKSWISFIYLLDVEKVQVMKLLSEFLELKKGSVKKVDVYINQNPPSHWMPTYVKKVDSIDDQEIKLFIFGLIIFGLITIMAFISNVLAGIQVLFFFSLFMATAFMFLYFSYNNRKIKNEIKRIIQKLKPQNQKDNFH